MATRTSRSRLLSPVELDEVTSQTDMAERGKRLSLFKEKTATHVWRHLPESGYWLLSPVIDGSVTKLVSASAE